MDCKTARLLLDYARPHATELDPAESAALEEHLSACADCDQATRAERRADEAIGQAMRHVDVPDQLGARILSRLKENRNERRRRQVGYGLRFAAAAAVLLLLFGMWRWYAVRPPFPAQRLLTDAQNRVIAPPSSSQVQTAFESQGVTTVPPADLNYSYLRWMFLTTVEGRQTPLMVFNNAGRRQHALVFIVPDSQFDVNALPSVPQGGNEYEYRCDIRYSADHRYGYVIYYTGDDLAWLDSPSQPPEAANGN